MLQLIERVAAVARPLSPKPETTISTEAAHAFVSSAVEKSASLRPASKVADGPAPKKKSSANKFLIAVYPARGSRKSALHPK
jgi:hypothetical protein